MAAVELNQLNFDGEQFISVDECSNQAGISKQAVYKRLEGTWQRYVSVIDGKKMVNVKALDTLKARPQTELMLELEEKQQQIDGLNSEIERLNQQLDKFDELKSEIEKVVNARIDNELNALQGHNDSLKANIESLTAENARLQNVLERLQDDLESRNKTIQGLTDFTTQVGTLTETNNRLQSEIDRLQDTLDKRDETIKELTAAATERHAETNKILYAQTVASRPGLWQRLFNRKQIDNSSSE